MRQSAVDTEGIPDIDTIRRAAWYRGQLMLEKKDKSHFGIKRQAGDLSWRLSGKFTVFFLCTGRYLFSGNIEPPPLQEFS